MKDKIWIQFWKTMIPLTTILGLGLWLVYRFDKPQHFFPIYAASVPVILGGTAAWITSKRIALIFQKPTDDSNPRRSMFRRPPAFRRRPD